MGGYIRKQVLPIVIDLQPIDKSRLIEIMKYLTGLPENTTSLEHLTEWFGLKTAKTDQLINAGIKAGLIDFKMNPIASLTERGKGYLSQNYNDK